MDRRRAVSMTERMSGSRLAPHSVRKPLQILRSATQGRNARSKPLRYSLNAGGSSSLFARRQSF